MEMAIDEIMLNRRSLLSRLGTGALAAVAVGMSGFPARADERAPATAATKA